MKPTGLMQLCLSHHGLYLAVPAVLDERRACSIVPGRALCVPGRTNPLRGRPDCDIGLGKYIFEKNIEENVLENMIYCILHASIQDVSKRNY